MTQQVDRIPHASHSTEWDLSSPLPKGGHVVRAVITDQLLHAQLTLGESRLDIFRGDEFAREVTNRASREVVLGHEAILKAAHDIPFFLAQLPQSDEVADPASLVYTPLTKRSSVILETSPQSPYHMLRYGKAVQLAEVRTDEFGDIYIDNFDIDNEIGLTAIKSIGDSALRACRLPDRDYIHPLHADTSDGITML